MFKRLYVLAARLVAAVALAAIVSAAYAQNPSAASNTAASPAPTLAPAAAAENNAMLAKAGKLYYSTAKYGLAGFTCRVHPDWQTLFASAQPGTSATDPRVALLQSVKVTLHARMKGGSTIDWGPAADPGKPVDQQSTNMLNGMHQGTEQTLQGFLQFWVPFVDGSAVPANSDGLEITRTDDGGYKLHSASNDTTVTELLDNQLTLTHFDVVLAQASVNLSPTYKSTPQGLLVNGFLAHLLPAGAPTAQTQEMHVAIDYQQVQDVAIPFHLEMNVAGSGVFNFTFDDCMVSKQ